MINENSQNEGNCEDDNATSTDLNLLPPPVSPTIEPHGKLTTSNLILIDTSHNDVEEETSQGSSNENKEVRVIHPQQFTARKSSEDVLLKNRSEIDHSLTKLIRPVGKKMSGDGLKDILRINFLSDLTIQTDNSTPCTATTLTGEQSRPLVEKSTQSIAFSSEDSDLGNVFSRHANPIESESRQTQISPSLVPPRPVHGEPPIQGAPPTYSAIMRIGMPPSQRRFLGGRRGGPQLEPSPPFINQVPPPTYLEAQGNRYGTTIIAIDSDIMWGPDPMPAACPRCGAFVMTTIISERSNLTHFAALSLCLCGCWPCCLLPYCTNSCKNAYHYCPNCETLLGEYIPW